MNPKSVNNTKNKTKLKQDPTEKHKQVQKNKPNYLLDLYFLFIKRQN
jgi:hypothetical protein